MVILVAGIGVIVCAWLCITSILYVISMFTNPEYHKAAMRATNLAYDANHGVNVDEAIKDFNQTNIHGFLVKRAFSLRSNSNGRLTVGGKYYVHEIPRKMGWAGSADSGLGGYG